MSSITSIFLAFTLSITLGSILIPAVKALATPLGLIDKPNLRKTHKRATPVIGGLAMFISSAVTLMILSFWINIPYQIIQIAIGATALLVVGVLDDRFQLKASTRLIIQFAVALFVAFAGIRLTSLYGIFGINELTYYESIGLTVFLIVGVVNAVNLLDGIDGLAGMFGVVGFSLFALINYIQSNYALVVLNIVLVSNTLIFLKHNFSKNKMFLGDAGSLMIGFLMVCFGLYLIQTSSNVSIISSKTSVALIIGVFLVPVLDSLRVYWTRLQTGYSPFRADRTHIHHLTLALKLNHKRASTLVIGLIILIISISLTGTYLIGIMSTLLILCILFISLTAIFYAKMRLAEWQEKINKLEYSN